MINKRLAEQELHHLGFIVKDLESTVRRLQDMYGAAGFLVYNFVPGNVWSYGEKVDGYQLKIAMGTIGTSGLKVEVIEPISGEGFHSDYIKGGKSGLHHVCFSIDADYEQWLERYKSYGMRIVFESETEDDVIGYRRFFYAEDPVAGLVVEVRESPYFIKD